MEIDDIEFTKAPSHPSLVVLKALLLGMDVKLDNRKIRLAERVGGGHSPVMITTAEKDGVSRPYVLGLDDMPLSLFLKYCESLTEQELTALSANLTLNMIRRGL